MELKSALAKMQACKVSGSNRTFMELKYDARKDNIEQQYVLIVPLWNWNSWLSYIPLIVNVF